MTKGRIIGVISIKGGVGKTTTVSNLGAALANDFGKKVLMVDANFSAPNLGLHLGLVNPKVTIHDVLRGKKKVGEAIYEHDENLHILPASMAGRKIYPLKLKDKIDGLREFYDIILIDSSPNLNEEILATMIAADELLVVSSPDYPTLSTTMHAVGVAKRKRTPITGLILNKVRNKKFELSIDDIEEASGVPVISVLPDDIKVLESLAATKATTTYSPKSNAAIEYKKLAACLIGQEYKDPRVWKRVKKVFSRKLSRDEINRKLLIGNINKNPE